MSICMMTCHHTISKPQPRVTIGNFLSFCLGWSWFTCVSSPSLSWFCTHWINPIRLFITFVSFLLLTTTSAPDPTYATHQISLWATFLGVSSALLAALQYAPQIVHTYRMKLVGALSIKMMLIQSPGALFMVLSIALRSVLIILRRWYCTDHFLDQARIGPVRPLQRKYGITLLTLLLAWIPYAVAGVMQATLLIICLSWKARQLKLGIDDFGNALFNDSSSQDGSSVTVVRGSYHDTTVSEGVRDSVDSNLRHDEGIQRIAPDNSTGEDTPLLAKDNRTPRRTWLARIFR